MPSPFPGMDPYLEGELWGNFHNQFAMVIAWTLNRQLVPRYVAVPEKYQNTVVTIPVNHTWIKIVEVKKRLLVTAIEFLSPSNKTGSGRRKYLKKRRRLLLSRAHFLEIDLLRRGGRVPMADPLPETPYFIFLSRARQRPATEVWPVRLDEKLPTVKVPLLAREADVDLELQPVFDSVYDGGAMECLIDYRSEPDVPLAPDWKDWADELLRAAGKRGRGKDRRR